MKIDKDEILESIKLFLLNLPRTLKKTTIWLIISYLIPIVNIFIIWGMRKNNFEIDLNIISIILVTNACFITSLVYVFNKEREFAKVLNIVTLVVTIVLFAISIVEIEQNKGIFSIELYKWGAYITLFLSILFGLISKYDEVEAESRIRAKNSIGKDSTNIDGKRVKI